MQVIVPLAGPDFVGSDGSIKALTPFADQFLLQHVLTSRPWAQEVCCYTFILKDEPLTRNFTDQYLNHWFPESTFVFLSSFTRGAACSAMAGVACQSDPHLPLIIDLADINYSSTLNVRARLDQSSRCGGLALTFTSDNPVYSYLRLDGAGTVVEAVEKKVISNNASAGTYIFRNSAIYLSAVAHAFKNEATQTCNNLFYVCPLFNGVIAQDFDVEVEPVNDVQDIKDSAGSPS